jgi:para-aminobenzoate synthetase component 1
VSRSPFCRLESTSPAGPLSRSSIEARNPRALLVAQRDRAWMADADGVHEWPLGPLEAIRRLLALVPPGRWPEEGGVAGALAYDFARPGRPAAPTPLLVALAVDRFRVHEDGGLVCAGSPASFDAAAADAALASVWPREAAPPHVPLALPLDLAAWSSLTRESHAALVARIQEHIARGDIYQANLSQRFRLPWATDAEALYAHLRRISPAPFAGHLRLAGVEIASASPERLLHVDGDRASTRPIAGTRPRALDERADDALRAELLLSEKERAEHLMLVDLARNDLGRVAALGSVRVDELMAIEDYAQVRHIVSNVEARLAPGRDAIDALAALFPGGTITGVPKRRCMEILDALEPVPRGFYTGALFYATPSGRLDANILIRSAVVAGGTLTFHAGGGIVADSLAPNEYQETLHKAEGLRLAIEAVLRGDQPTASSSIQPG